MADFWTAHLQDTARHLVRMSETPGFSDHARHRRDELLADQTYAGLREEIQRVRAGQRTTNTAAEAATT